ncbi:hypothetical protein RIV54_002194 [Salmonella enterica]|nr:hypothetical protein [Salmonella enterica]
MHKKRSKCRAQVTGEQPTQQGLEGNPGENVAKSSRERLCVRRTGTRWRDSIAQTCARLRGAEALFLKGDSGRAWPLMC